MTGVLELITLSKSSVAIKTAFGLVLKSNKGKQSQIHIQSESNFKNTVTQVIGPSSYEWPRNSSHLVGCGKAYVNSEMVEGRRAEPEQRQRNRYNNLSPGESSGWNGKCTLGKPIQVMQ